MRGAVIVPEGKIARGKLAQALMHVLAVALISLRGNFDQALESGEADRRAASRRAGELHQSLPAPGPEDRRVRGLRGAWAAPDALAIPVGNAGNITAWWKGFNDTARAWPGRYGFQAEGAAPIVLGHVVDQPETVASAIRIGNPARWQEAVAALDESQGRIASVSDDEILEAQRWLASSEGVFCEPARQRPWRERSSTACAPSALSAC